MNAHFTEFRSLDRLTPKILLLQRYFMRSTMDGSPAGTAMFDRIIDYGEEWLARTDLKVSDPRAFVGLLTVMKMSMFTMRDLLSRAAGTDVGSVEGWRRVLDASLDLFSQPLITPVQADQARAQLDKIFGEVQP